MMKAPVLQSDTLLIEPMSSHDLDALYAAASDPLIWAGHPAKTRYQRAEFQPYFDFLLHAGGTVVFREKPTDRVFGCSRYYIPPEVPDSIGIGYTFITRDHWGGAANRAIKSLMLDHAFETFDEVWFHIAPDNIRSQKATAKLGAKFVDVQSLDLGTGVTSWSRWVLKRSIWYADHKAPE